jgi:hypothetical protein
VADTQAFEEVFCLNCHPCDLSRLNSTCKWLMSTAERKSVTHTELPAQPTPQNPGCAGGERCCSPQTHTEDRCASVAHKQPRCSRTNPDKAAPDPTLCCSAHTAACTLKC